MEKKRRDTELLSKELARARQRISQLEATVDKCAVEEETLLRSNETLRAMIESSPVAIMNLDADGKVLIWNKAAELTFGWKATEALGRINPIVPEESKDEFDKIRGLAMRGPITGLEIRRRKKDGSFIDLSLSTSAIFGSRGNVVGYIAMFLDITARKKAEEELERSHAHLEELIGKRTAQLQEANEKLKKYAEELESSNRGLEQFAYMASHDLQAPLLSIASSLKLFRRHFLQGKLRAEEEKFLADAVESTTRMQNFIKGLLAYAKTGMVELQLKRTDSSLALDSALANLADQIRESGTIVTHGPLPVLQTDPFQLPHVFQNLIGNAIKFRGNQPPRVHVQAERQTDPETGRKFWIFSVRDNGIGIPAGSRDEIFDIFHRVKGSTERPGAGIGLAICKRIVERLGGKIWVESEEGRGSVFYFRLPSGPGKDRPEK